MNNRLSNYFIIFLIICSLPNINSIFAQLNDSIIDTKKDTLNLILVDSLSLELNFDANLDTMVNLWYVKENVNYDSIEAMIDEKDVIPTFPDSVYMQRISDIHTVVDLTYNTLVRRYIERYTQRHRKQVEIMLGLAEYYFPIFDDIFDYYDVPNELKYMSIIESALNPRAYSRARAVGIWQFIYSTGRLYGLTINSLVDERRDPIKSTHAAAQHIKHLNERYDDWILALAAYNCGSGNVNKAIRRSGGKTNFWDIYFYLPRETRGHVPAFIAATYLMKYHKEHNIYPVKANFPIKSDTILMQEKMHLQQVADVLKIPIKKLRDMNPQYRADIIPASPKKKYAIILPQENINQFINLKDSIIAYKDSIYLAPEKISISPTRYTSRYLPEPPGDNMTKIVYRVKSGDNLGFISEWYDVRISDLRYWNNIRNNFIRSGQKLVIYVPKNKASKYKHINSLSFVEKQKIEGKTVTNVTQKKSINANLDDDQYIYYVVKPGDTLWDIAKQFENITDTDIMRLNNIKNASKIKPGQKLKIKPKS